MKVSDFLSEKDEKAVISAIHSAESSTSGEIRVHIEVSCKEDIMDRAAYIFQKLNMHRTRERNGVLIYVAIENRKFAIIGDIGINSKVPANFWEQTKNIIEGHFRKNEFREGLIKGILNAGEQLKKFFPYTSDDINELPDSISYGL